MYKITVWVKLFRVKHYIKNFLIFVPLFFSGNFGSSIEQIKKLMIAFIAFSLMSSLVYIINDINDRDADRLHEIKCKRPIASGQIQISHALIVAVILAITLFGLNWLAMEKPINKGLFYLLLYLILNLLYSFRLKNIPIVDVMILASGFLIRIMYGAQISNIRASDWLILTIIAFSLYMGLGKRRNEILKQGEHTQTRIVLKQYTYEFCDKMMNASMTLGIAFYSLWTISMTYSNILIWSILLVIFICMKYTLIIEGNSHGDPVDVLLKDKMLIVVFFIYAIYMCLAIYII
ncbi:decaprenyl-phosphate phosphoribosyltransferase [Lachnospiraceae bacterium]|nr:decaprenyl-phosphate phosphoribosyltransferase [Lachnospiraceae bacterium]